VFDKKTSSVIYKRFTVPSLLLGAGFMQPIGRNAGFRIELLYDLIQNPYSPYYQQLPIINGGIVVGI
jgi:hypothetical protein